MEQDTDWAIRMTAEVGRRVERFRGQAGDDGKKLTVQALSERCSALGLPLDRSVIAKLEKGLRQTITVGEVMVLAKALRVPPILLIFPVGREARTEVLPGQVTDTWDAAQWFAGYAPLIITDDEGVQQRLSPEELKAWNAGASQMPGYAVHAQLVDLVLSARQTAERSDKEVADIERRRARELEQQISLGREEFRRAGVLPPPLPPVLAHLDDELGDE